MSDFKSSSFCGQLEVARWKSPDVWPDVGLQEDCVVLQSVISSPRCSSLQEEDVLAWSPNPLGVYIVASRYKVLLSHRMNGEEVQWWKKVWNKFPWPKCNCFVWMLAWNNCLTWDNIHKRGFHGPSICVLCGAAEEESSHLFLHCPFAIQIWNF